MRLHALLAPLAVLVAAAAPLAAQRAAAVVRVHVVDTAGRAVAGAEVAAMRGLDTRLAAAVTDASGRQTLSVPQGDDDLELVVRKIGFQRGGHFFRAERDTLSLVVTMRTATQTLPAVQVTAEQSLRVKRFSVGAEDIANSSRPIRTGLDVITKLRPDMMAPPGPGIYAPRCGIRDIWINGTRIVFPPIDPSLAIRASQERRAARATANRAAGREPRYTPLSTVPVSVQSVLETLHPEHIDEMKFVDCRDSESTDFTHGQNALFVVLKRGVGFDLGRGTYVLDQRALAASDVADVEERTTAAFPMYRHRLVGVFDETTGDPIPDVEIVELSTGTFAKTTSTGTATLAFLPEGSSAIQLRRAGYTDLKLDVTIGPRDTMPLTLVLSPRRSPR